jgi:hypothetical protein
VKAAVIQAELASTPRDQHRSKEDAEPKEHDGHPPVHSLRATAGCATVVDEQRAARSKQRRDCEEDERTTQSLS